MKRCVSLVVSISLISINILYCSNISFANNQNFNYNFLENQHNSNSSNLNTDETEGETHDDITVETDDDIIIETSDNGGDHITFVPDRIITFNEALSELSDLLNQYKHSNDITLLNKSILVFGEIPRISKSLTNDTVANSEKLKDLFYSIREECYNLDSIKKQEVYTKLFAEEIFLGWKYDKNIKYFKDNFLIKGLIDYNKNRLVNIQERLDYLLYVIDFYEEFGDPFPEYNFIPEIDEQVYPDVPPGGPSDDEDSIYEEDDFYDDMIVTGPNAGDNNQGNDSSNNENQGSTPPEESSSLTTYYKNISNNCYKITELTKNGHITEVERILADKSEYIYCGIYDYVDFGDGYASGHIVIDEEYINTNQNELSSYYAYYTVTNNEEAPYYYNTGIRADANSKTVSYNQLKDIFYHLAIKNKSFTIDSNSKSLYIFDGKPIVLNQTVDDSYSQKDIDRLLKPFSQLGVKIMKDEDYKICQTKYEQSQSEKDVNYVDEIIIDGIPIYEDKIAWIEGDVLKVSIKTIADLLSAKTEVKNDHLIIKKEDVKITLYNKQKEYTVNNENKSFISNVSIKKGNYISELADIPELLGYNVEFNSSNNNLIFTKS